ncbi:MAG: succinate dehydrogenase cytochrome b subunit [Chitinophagaceae bacterium]|nr:succinate dehydrogenase cytochrome b subunit [Chitinophagaceae bacterium]
MKWSEFFTSSVGKKFVMGFTGLFLISFLVIHVGLNACIWANDNGVMFNKAAHFMGSMVVIRIMEVGLLAGIFLHAIQGLVLTAQNYKRRSVGYAVPMGNTGSPWYSRWMGLLGTLILLFLILHWYNFWIPSRFTGVEEVFIDNKPYDNLYGLMLLTFSNWWVVIVYVLGCISLAYHLMQGFHAAFKSLGFHNRKYLVVIRNVGNVFSIVVSGAFAMMPISMKLGWVS